MADQGDSLELPLETFSKVVEAVYDRALDPNRWQVGLVADLTRSQRCALGVDDYASPRRLSVGIRQATIENVREALAKITEGASDTTTGETRCGVCHVFWPTLPCPKKSVSHPWKRTSR